MGDPQKIPIHFSTDIHVSASAAENIFLHLFMDSITQSTINENIYITNG
jgi:hypothetical protein